MRPYKLPTEPFTEGDSWDGIPAAIVTIGPEGGPFVAPASPLSLVTMRFQKLGSENEPIVELSSATAGEITIVSAANWEFSIPEQIVPGLTEGKWIWQIKCKDSTATGTPKTWMAGEQEVLASI